MDCTFACNQGDDQGKSKAIRQTQAASLTALTESQPPHKQWLQASFISDKNEPISVQTPGLRLKLMWEKDEDKDERHKFTGLAADGLPALMTIPVHHLLPFTNDGWAANQTTAHSKIVIAGRHLCWLKWSLTDYRINHFWRDLENFSCMQYIILELPDWQSQGWTR